MKHGRCAAGLVLVELAAALAVVAVLAALLLIASGESRRQSSLGDNLANLKQFASATGAYGADNDGRVWGFSWQRGVDYGFGGVASSDQQAAANQAWHILRTRFGHPQFLGAFTPPDWFPYPIYSHLSLIDYLDARTPEDFTIAPEDRLRRLWASDPLNFESLPPGTQRPLGTGVLVRRWPFSSSYELPPAFYSHDVGVGGSTVAQSWGDHHHRFLSGTLPLGPRRLAEVALPSQKVMLFEQHQRHFGPRQLYFAYNDARIPLLLADGSAAVRRTADANWGFEPNSPLSPTYTRVLYQPQPWEPPTLSGQASQVVGLRYRFTRSGLRGRDFGGPEVPWTE